MHHFLLSLELTHGKKICTYIIIYTWLLIRYFDLYDEPPPDVTCFDLDTMSISKSEILKILKISLLPKKPLKKLRSTLREIQDDILKADIERQRKERRQFNTLRMNWELAIREAFLRYYYHYFYLCSLLKGIRIRFMCSLMSGYTKFLRPIKKPPDRPNATETRTLFDIASFLRTRDKNSTQFYERFCATQCFNRFIEERSFVSEKNSNFIFFDDCIRKHYTGVCCLIISEICFITNFKKTGRNFWIVTRCL